MNQSDEKTKRKVIRFIGGICFTIVFIIFAYISISVAPHSSDIPDDYDITNLYHRGVEREKVQLPEQSASPTQAPSVTQEEVETVPETSSELASVAETGKNEGETEAEAETTASSDLPDVDLSSWELILVNSDNKIGSDFAPEEIVYLNMTADDRDKPTEYDGNRLPIDSRIADALLDFAEGCKEAGLPVFLSSGYRSYNEQQTLLNNKINSGYDYDTAITIVAEPGTSEHQTGLCCDITDVYHQLKDSSLAETDTFKWLNEHCAEYGFILRYPEDKSGGADTITGVIYEPWHFRYVGKEAAQYIKEHNLCLEEFIALYES